VGIEGGEEIKKEEMGMEPMGSGRKEGTEGG